MKIASQEIGEFLRLLRELQKIDPEFPLQYAVCLAMIAQNEGLSLTELSERTSLAISTVSRIVGALSKHRQKGVPYGLVEVRFAPNERRRKELSLTLKGRAVIDSISEILSRAA